MAVTLVQTARSAPTPEDWHRAVADLLAYLPGMEDPHQLGRVLAAILTELAEVGGLLADRWQETDPAADVGAFLMSLLGMGLANAVQPVIPLLERAMPGAIRVLSGALAGVGAATAGFIAGVTGAGAASTVAHSRFTTFGEITRQVFDTVREAGTRFFDRLREVGPRVFDSVRCARRCATGAAL